MERFLIGEFARITRLSVKALRHYDELGLLRPAQVDPWTGYRSYTLAQASRARAIALLRSIDMPLPAIGEVLAAGDEQELRLLLGRHRAQLEEQLDEYRQKLFQVERLIQRGEVVMGLDVQVKQRPATTLWALRLVCQGDSEQIGEVCGPAYHRLYEALAEADVAPAGPPWLRYLDMSGEQWQLEAGVPVPAGAVPPAGVERSELPADQVATAVHRGPYSELGLAYRELQDWLDQRGHRPAGPPADIYLNDPGKTAPPDLETEVSVPVAASSAE